MILRGVRYACGPQDCVQGSLIITEGRIARILHDPLGPDSNAPDEAVLDLDGLLLLPGLINAHDHLHFSLYPRLGNPPYSSYIDWGEDIHATHASVIRTYKKISKATRLWWGGIRNLLCGVTTVCHHDALHAELQRHDFPVRVIQHYGWAHSLALGKDLVQAWAATRHGAPFIVHACEGVDEAARQEIFGLDQLGVLDANTVLVHGLALDEAGIARMQERGASFIACPSSNAFLFETLPSRLIHAIENTSLGSDSPITGTGDLLDEIRFTLEQCDITPDRAYHMVTAAPAKSLRLKNNEGTIREGGIADMIAIRDTGTSAANRLRELTFADIECVWLGGQVQLASDDVFRKLPDQTKQGMEHLRVNGTLRWLRAPIRLLMQEAEAVLGSGNVSLGGKSVRLTAVQEATQSMLRQSA